MECTLAALVACFSWSGFYIDGGLSIRDVKYAEVVIHSAYDVDYVARSHNPFGRLAFGFDARLSPTLSAAIEVSHESSVRTGNDRGVNSAMFSVRWRPFARSY